jgi:hypothetical protein
MKKYSFLLVLIFLATILNVVAKPLPEKTLVSVVETDNYYELRATYHERKNEALKEAINNSIQPDKLFGQSITQYDAYIVLDDGTRFRLKFSDTKIVIKFSKKANSSTSYEKMQKVFAAVKKVLN